MCRNLSEFEPPQPCHGQPVSPVMALGVKEEGLRWDNSAIVLQQVCKATLTIQARTAELLRCFSSSLVMLLPAPKPSSCSACVVPHVGQGSECSCQTCAEAHIRLWPLAIPFLVRFAHAKYQFSQRAPAFAQLLCKFEEFACSVVTIR